MNITSLALHTMENSISIFEMACVVFHKLEKFHTPDLKSTSRSTDVNLLNSPYYSGPTNPDPYPSSSLLG